LSGRRARAPRRWLYLSALPCLLPVICHAAQATTQPGNPPARAAETTPAIPPDQPVSLQQAIQIAHQNHGRIATAEENVEAARQRVRQARAGTLPQIRGAVNYQGRGTSSLGGLFGAEPSQTVTGPGGQPLRQRINTDAVTFDRGLQPQIALDYNIFNGGLTRAQVRQARAGVEGSIGGLQTVRNDQALIVTQNYLAQLQFQRTLELRRVQEALALEQLRRVEARIAAGSAAAADRALVESEYRNRVVESLTAQNQVRVSANSLRNSMGLPVGPPLTLVELRESLTPLAPVEVLRDLAMRQRPEVVQDEAAVRQAQAGLSIARIARTPRLDTTVAFGLTPNDPFSRSNFQVFAGVSLPIWDAGLTHAREQEARSGVEAASAQLEQTRKDVTADVEEAYLNLISARERVDASRLAVEASQVNLEATTARYELGAAGTTVVDLIQAQEQFATASNNAIQALYDTFLAQAQLERAIGR
jgi:outer membrane protein TolC